MSEFVDKKIINIYDGEMMGTAGDSDLLIDPQSGHILELILPSERGFGIFTTKDRRQYSIPWGSVKKVGAEVVVVDVDDSAKLVR
jgi:YlmC/YmxH family sporulation protein